MILGGPRLAQARKMTLESIGAAADNRAANVLPIIREIRKAGATTLRRLRTPQCARRGDRAGRPVVRDDCQQCPRSGVNHHVRYTREMRYSVRSTSNFPKATTKSAKTQYDKIQFMEWS